MPSPLSHAAIGYVIYRYSKSHVKIRPMLIWIIPPLLLIEVFLALLPDVDSVIGILLGNFGQYHNNGTHSLLVGFMITIVIGGIVSLKQRRLAWVWFIIVLMAYNLHVIMDYFTVGRGVMLFWPLSTQRYLSPMPLFFGLHWSEGFLAAKHLITLGTELLFVLVLFILTYLFDALRKSQFLSSIKNRVDRS